MLDRLIRLPSAAAVVRVLDEYARHGSRISAMGIQVLPLDGEMARASHETRCQVGPLVHDSIAGP